MSEAKINFIKQQGFEGASALAATFMLLVPLLAGSNTLAWVVEAILPVALGALIFGAFCLGSYVFHLLIGHGEFAKRTLPSGAVAFVGRSG